ncbi:MAG: hypothetical protein JNK82_04250 [Myxococcaceae bacterium]|nr:hypothetical protein [Myxococcaceae bacterium]
MVEVLGEWPGVKVGKLGSVLVSVWRGTITPQLVEQVNALQGQLIKEHGDITAVGVLTGQSSGVPSEELRQASIMAMKRFQAHVRGSALVIATSGVKAMLARTFFAGLSLMLSPSSPHRAFRTVEEAMRWLVEHDPRLDLGAAIRDIEAFAAQALELAPMKRSA